jgi:hypothetical protein
METKPDYTYNANEPVPYVETVRKVKAWAKRLQARTGRQVYYAVKTSKVEIYHSGIDTKSHNKAMESLALILGKVLLGSYIR